MELIMDIICRGRLATFLGNATGVLNGSSMMATRRSRRVTRLARSANVAIPALVIFFTVITIRVVVTLITSGLCHGGVTRLIGNISRGLRSNTSVAVGPLVNSGNSVPRSRVEHLFVTDENKMDFFTPYVTCFTVNVLRDLVGFFWALGRCFTRFQRMGVGV